MSIFAQVGARVKCSPPKSTCAPPNNPPRPGKLGFTFHPTPRELLRDRKVSFGALHLFAVLRNFSKVRSGSLVCVLCNETLATELSCSVSEVKRFLLELEKAGLTRRAYGASQRVREGIEITWIPAEHGAEADVIPISQGTTAVVASMMKNEHAEGSSDSSHRAHEQNEGGADPSHRVAQIRATCGSDPSYRVGRIWPTIKNSPEEREEPSQEASPDSRSRSREDKDPVGEALSAQAIAAALKAMARGSWKPIDPPGESSTTTSPEVVADEHAAMLLEPKKANGVLPPAPKGYSPVIPLDPKPLFRQVGYSAVAAIVQSAPRRKNADEQLAELAAWSAGREARRQT